RLLRKEPGMRPDVEEVRQVLESVARPPVVDPTGLFTGSGAGAGGGSRWVPPVLHGNRPARYGILGGLVAVVVAVAVLVTDPFGGGGLPGGWEVRNDREVVSATIAVPSDYRRTQDDNGTSVTYKDPSGVFEVHLDRVEQTAVDNEIEPTKEAWREHYSNGGNNRREIEDQKVTVSGTKHQGKNAFDTTVDYVPYSYSSTADENQVRYRWQERIVSTGSAKSGVYWRLRVSGPAEGWAAEEGDKLFDRVVEHLKIEGL
ncbi:serine/threonine protein kinase, partial [Streptomyces sp. NPDC051018]